MDGYSVRGRDTVSKKWWTPKSTRVFNYLINWPQLINANNIDLVSKRRDSESIEQNKL